MSKLRAMVFFAIVAALAGSAFAADTAFIQANGTTDQVALFAAFVVNVPEGLTPSGDPIRTSFTISNLMSAPEGLMNFDEMTTVSGPIHFFLFANDGSMTTISTDELDSPEAFGNMQLDEDGALEAGKTLVFFMNELAAAAGLGDDVFTGYMWIVCDFDAAGGTYNTFDAAQGLSQSFKLDPAMAEGAWFFGGIPVDIE